MARKVLLITGASSGIGAAVARRAAAGYDVALNFNANRAGAEAVARDLQAAGARTVLCPADLTDPAGIDAMFATCDAAFGRIDALVNNAGIVDLARPVTGIDHARLRQMFDLNVIAPFLCAGAAVTRMQAQGGGGVIVNISSVAARLGSGGAYVDYAASKAAMDTFTKGLADEVAGDGIRVISVRPGIIETEIHAKGGQPDRVARLGPGLPMGRAGSVEEVAEAVHWLMSDAASYITGTTLDVSGGR
ncbi:MAG: SDR family oxidoreductase [Rhodobacteraceae bacterium]|nr:SDR family oxidoreductase [Paracoccaceae bacterium]